MPAQTPSFLSYSRKDYYFAESLAFHLQRQGVPVWLDVRDLEPGIDWERGLEAALDAAPALVLVGSPDSMASAHVRNEWQRAILQGKRIIVARFRGAKMPSELQQCECVDFRWAFGRGLRALAARLTSAAPASAPRMTTGAGGSWVAMPPWVALMAATLAIPSLAYLLLANWEPDPAAPLPAAAEWALIPIATLLFVWFLCITFLRRQMGMTRLAICLAFLTAVFAIPLALFALLGETTAHGYEESIVRSARDHWRAGLALAAIPFAGLVVLVLVRPEDLLRWAPTGTVWPVYRVGHVADAVFDRAELVAQFGKAKRYFVLHDPADAPMAERLRQQLAESGATEVAVGAEGATTVLLLSGRTRTSWLERQTARLPSALLTVVGSAIRLPQSPEQLWRRQWIDFRGWNLRRRDREKALPQVPEAVTRPRYPAVVNRAHHLLCALGALLFTLAGKLDTYFAGSDELSVAMLAAAAGALWWGLLARRLLRRSHTAPAFARDCRIGWIATALIVVVSGYAMATHGESLGRVLLIVALPVAIYFAWWRQRRDLAFWYPQERAAREPPAHNLGPSRNWRTLIVFTVYLFVWFLIVGAPG